MKRGLHPEEVEERQAAFQRAWRERWLPEVALMPANRQDRVHGLLKEAFRAGADFERRKQEPEQLGGMD